MKQFKITLPTDLRVKLDAASSASGRSVAEEIRQRVEASFDPRAADPDLYGLILLIEGLAGILRFATGHRWNEHPAALYVFQQAILAHFARLRASPPLDGKAEFAPGELPPIEGRLVASDNLDAMAAALEAIAMSHRERQDIASIIEAALEWNYEQENKS